eukprot:TRINITY_DN5359_c0_g1_i1.p1 TRINITY_DN5359_c0_g1~~TRINITY_DN5359_c0_g1_i1.p1  ORF type:complete len:575 (+),score=230.18 TRINITY_DN5359_c0_g1_i1:88-1812(+)
MWSLLSRMSIRAPEASVISRVRATTTPITRSTSVVLLQRRNNSNKPAGQTAPTPKIQNKHANKPLHAPRDHLRSTHRANPAGNNEGANNNNRPNYNNTNNDNSNNTNAPRQFRPRDGQNNRPFTPRPNKEGQGRPPRTFTNGDKQTFTNSNRTGAQEGDGNKKFRRTEPARVEGVKPPTILRTARDRATIPSSKRSPDSELLPEDYEAYEADLEALHRTDMGQFEEPERPEPTLPEEDMDPRASQEVEEQELFINDHSQPDPRRAKKFAEKKKNDKYKTALRGNKKQRGEEGASGPLPVGAAKKRKRTHEDDEDEEGSAGPFNFPGARQTNLISTQSRYLDTAVFDVQAEQLATSQKLQAFAADYAAQGEVDASMRMAVTDMRRNVSANFEREMQRERSQRLQALKLEKTREKWLTKRRAEITASRAELKSRAKAVRAKAQARVTELKQQAGAAYYAELNHWFTREELLVPQVRDALSAVMRNPTMSKQQRLQLVLNVQKALEDLKKMPNDTKRMYRELLLPENLNRAKPTDVRLIEHNMVIPIYDWHQMIALAESEMTPEEKAKRYAPPPSDK